MKPTDRFGVRVLVSDGTLPKWATLIFGEWESPEKKQADVAGGTGGKH
jgi:hypothetical protein